MFIKNLLITTSILFSSVNYTNSDIQKPSFNTNFDVNYNLCAYDEYIGQYSNISYGNNIAYGSMLLRSLTTNAFNYSSCSLYINNSTLYTDVDYVTFTSETANLSAYFTLYFINGSNLQLFANTVSGCTIRFHDTVRNFNINSISYPFYVYTNNTQLEFDIYLQPYYFISKIQSSFNLSHLGLKYDSLNKTFQYIQSSNTTFNFEYLKTTNNYLMFKNYSDNSLFIENAIIYNNVQYDLLSSYFSFSENLNYSYDIYLSNEKFYSYLINFVKDLNIDYDTMSNNDFIYVLDNTFNENFNKNLFLTNSENYSYLGFDYSVEMVGNTFKIKVYSIDNSNISELIVQYQFNRSLDNNIFVITEPLKSSGNHFVLYEPSFFTSYTLDNGSLTNINNINFIYDVMRFDELSAISRDVTFNGNGNLSDVLNLFTLAIGSFTSFFSIVILPGLTLGTFVLIPFTLTILFFIIRLFKR